MSERDKQFKALKAQLNNEFSSIEKFVECFKSGGCETNYLIYEFQSMMDGLVPLKEKADELTRTLDHG